MEKLLYGSLFTIITFIDLFLAYRCFKKQSAKGVPLGCCISCAAVISFLYMLCIMTENHQVMSISSSIYFCFIDLMLLFFLDFFFCLYRQSDVSCNSREDRPDFTDMGIF